VAPTDTLPVVRFDTKVEKRSLDTQRWGLIPYWAKDIAVGFSNINTKSCLCSGQCSSRAAITSPADTSRSSSISRIRGPLLRRGPFVWLFDSRDLL